jgi:hypothetical protein
MNPNGDQSEAIPEPASEVGYGRPPEATRFRKGTSGNPKGRPRGSLNVATLFMKTLRERVVINENGQRKTVTKLEAALKQLVNKSATGDLRALRQLVELARDAEAKQNTSGTQSPAIGKLDQEVIDGIVKRFEGTEAQIQEAQEANDVDDQRG